MLLPTVYFTLVSNCNSSNHTNIALDLLKDERRYDRNLQDPNRKVLTTAQFHKSSDTKQIAEKGLGQNFFTI